MAKGEWGERKRVFFAVAVASLSEWVFLSALQHITMDIASIFDGGFGEQSRKQHGQHPAHARQQALSC